MMEKFYLVLIKKDGTIVHDIFATSHRDLIDKYLTSDEIKSESFFMAQYHPKEGHRLDEADNYVLLNAGMFYPNWFDGEFKEQVMLDLKAIIGSMIVRGRKKLLLHEGVILSNKVVVEVKAIEALADIHLAQLLTYLRLSDSKLGLLVNFNVLHLKQGIKRVIL